MCVLILRQIASLLALVEKFKASDFVCKMGVHRVGTGIEWGTTLSRKALNYFYSRAREIGLTGR